MLAGATEQGGGDTSHRDNATRFDLRVLRCVAV